METRVLVLSFGLACVSGVGAVAAGQHEGHQTGSAAAPSAAQVIQCRQVQPVIAELLNAAVKRLEDARLTNSAVAMRDAADDVQAALVDVRTQLAPCAEMQPGSAAPQTAAAMPNAQTSGTGPPGVPATQPGAAAPAPAAADSHAGHTTPPAPQTPAMRVPAAAAAPTRSTPQRPAAAAADHAGHTTPAAPASRAPSASTPRPSAAAPSNPPAADAHAGHAMPPASSPAATAGRATAAAPPTSIADLKCTDSVDPRTAPRMLYQGRMYYFCTGASRAEFARDPARYVTAEPQAAPAHAH